MLTINDTLTEYRLGAGEPFLLQVAFQDKNGAPVDISARAFVLSFYKADRSLERQLAGVPDSDSEGQFLRFEEDGALSESLYGGASLKVELAERYLRGRNVIATGSLTIAATAATVQSLGNGPIGACATRIVVKASATLSAVPVFSQHRVAWVAQGSAPTVTPGVPVFTTAPSFSPASGTAGVTTFTASDGAASNASGYTRRWLLSGTAIGTGTTVTPNAAGSLALEVIAHGPGGDSAPATTAAVTVAAAPTLSLSAPIAQAEGNSGTTAFVYTLTLTRNGSTAAIPFAWAVTGTGANPADAADFGGTFPSGSGTFAAGETSKTITVLVTGDTAVEPDEAFLLTVTSPGLASVSANGTIVNEDALPALTLTGPLTYATNAAAGTLVANIGNVPAGVTPTLTPNDGRLVVAGSQQAGWTAVVGMSASSAGTISLSVAAAGATGATASVSVTAAPAAAIPAEIWLGWGDSTGVGINLADRSIDTYGSAVNQVRQRAPAGISNVIAPLDQAIDPNSPTASAPNGTDYLSPYESFAKQRAADTGRTIYLVPHNYNGSKFAAAGSGGYWGVGNDLHNAFIARANAAIRLVQNAVPGALLGGIIQFEGTNDQGGDAAAYKALLNNAITDMRARIFKNGTSGATAGDLPFIIAGTHPEGRTTGATINAYPLALKETAATITNGRFYPIPEGYQDSTNIHATSAAERLIGPALAARLTDTTAPTITFPATYAAYEQQKLLLELTASEDAWWTLTGAGASNFEVIWLPDGPTGISYTRLKPYLRWAGDAAKPVGTYAVTLTATDNAHNVATKTFTVSVVAAYGASTGAAGAAAYQSGSVLTVPNANNAYIAPAMQFGAGLNLILVHTNGSVSAMNGISVNGAAATRLAMQTNGDIAQLWAVPLAQAGSYPVSLSFSGTLGSGQLEVITMTNTPATPTSVALLNWGYNTSPHRVAGVVCPTGGIIGVLGVSPAVSPTALAGETLIGGAGTVFFAATRSTTGDVGFTSAGNYSTVVAAAFGPGA